MRWFALTFAFLAGVATGETDTAPAPRPALVGVLVDQTRGEDARAVAAARRDVAVLRSRGVPAQLRVTRSPSASLAAASTLASRGATRLIVYGADPARVLEPLPAAIAVDRR